MSGLDNVLGNVYRNADDEPRRPSMDDVQDSLAALAEEAASRSHEAHQDEDSAQAAEGEDPEEEPPTSHDVDTTEDDQALETLGITQDTTDDDQALETLGITTQDTPEDNQALETLGITQDTTEDDQALETLGIITQDTTGADRVEDPGADTDPGAQDWMATAIDALTESEIPEPGDLFEHVPESQTDSNHAPDGASSSAIPPVDSDDEVPAWLAGTENGDESDWLSALEQPHTENEDSEDDQALEALGITTQDTTEDNQALETLGITQDTPDDNQALETLGITQDTPDDNRALETLGISSPTGEDLTDVVETSAASPEIASGLSDDEFSQLLSETDDSWLDQLFEVAEETPRAQPDESAIGPEPGAESTWLNDLLDESEDSSHPQDGQDDPLAVAEPGHVVPDDDPTGLGLVLGSSAPEQAETDSFVVAAPGPSETVAPAAAGIPEPATPTARAESDPEPTHSARVESDPEPTHSANLEGDAASGPAVEALEIPPWTRSDDDIVPRKRSRGRGRRQESEAEVAQLTDDPIELFSPETDPQPSRRGRRNKTQPTDTQPTTTEKPTKKRRRRNKTQPTDTQPTTTEKPTKKRRRRLGRGKGAEESQSSGDSGE